MAVFKAQDFVELSRRIKGKDNTVKKASVLTINKSATFSRRESVEQITKEVNLKQSYVNGHLRVVKRASPGDLTAIVRGNERGTLLQRYPYSLSGDVLRVQINRTGSALTIKGARMVNLKGSGEKVVGLFNRDAMEVFTRALSKGEGATAGKRKKLFNIERRAAAKPYGRTPLHSRSINQLFTSVRDTIQPALRTFMRETFLKDFNRLDK